MANIYGEKLSKRDILERVSDLSQICGTRAYQLSEGKSKGMRAIDIKTGGGLSYTVLPDRGLDIAWAEYKGIPISFISKSGIASPQYFCTDKSVWGESFYGGLLTTCGLMQVGNGCVYKQRKYNAHGKISNIACEKEGIIHEWEKDELIMGVKGIMNESLLYRENLQLRRTITSKLGENKIHINDVVENNGFQREPLMMLYHINFGYPFLGEDTFLDIPSEDIIPVGDTKQEDTQEYDRFHQPKANYSSKVFHHKLKGDREGNVCCKIINNKFNFGVSIEFNNKQLWNFTQWKNLCQGDFVVGLEPCNNYGMGIENEEQNGSLEYIEPGESREFNVIIGIIE